MRWRKYMLMLNFFLKNQYIILHIFKVKQNWVVMQ